MREIYGEIASRLRSGLPCAVATLVAARQAAPASIGTSMLVDSDGSFTGNIGAGCHEAELVESAGAALRDESPRTIDFDVTDELLDGSSCGAVLTVAIWLPDPSFAVANANMAWGDVQQGSNLDVALSRAQKAKSLMPDAPSVSDTLAWVMYKRGNYAAAMPLLQECVQKSPDSSQFHYHLGLTLIAAGQKAKGREQLESALRLKLDNADALQAQQLLAAAN